MALKLFTLLALFAACGIVHSEKFSDGGSSGGQSSGSESGSSSGGSGISEFFEQFSNFLGGRGTESSTSGSPLPFSNGGSSGGQSSGSESGSSSGGPGISELFEQFSIFLGGRGTESSTSGGQSGQSMMSRQGVLPRQSSQVGYCKQVCNNAAHRVSRIPSSGSQGASHGFKERRGERSSLPQPVAGQHSRQGPSSSGACPSFCSGVLANLPGSGSSSQSSSIGESGTSASGSDGSSSTSRSSSGSSGGSTGGSSSGK